ncbi:MAG: nucleoside phosphorylase [Chloroflexi bacterium]|nr:nucleoside phosphorylase [Chloroflexota bacterium]
MSERSEYIHERMGGQLQPGDVAPYVLVPGSEKRVKKFAGAWDEARQVAQHYEFLLYSGKMAGIPISACSTGCGGRSTSIVVDELAALGAHTFIRVGVTGPLQSHLKVGDLVIASGVVRMDKTSEHYVFIDYPAVADVEVTCALIAAAEKVGAPYHVGIGATSSSFYTGEGISGYRGYRHSGMDPIEADLTAANVLDWDTESATIFTLCSLYGLRAGRINVIVDDPETNTYNPFGEERAVQTALEAIKILAAWDQKKKASGAHYILPPYPTSHKSA